jgi:ABC-type Zn uptake system ZnuABC Zn-binding protein ZnuA
VRVPVVATVYPLADVARQAGAGRVDVEWWVESGQSIVDYAPDRAQVDRLRKASVVLSGGTGEAVVTNEFAGQFGDRRLVRLDALVERPDDRDAGQQWLDPRLVRLASERVTEVLVTTQPVAADGFRDAGTTFRAALDGLIADAETRLIGLDGRTIASVGKDYAALARFGGFNLVRLSEEPAIRLAGERLGELRRGVVSSGATLLLVEADTPAAVLRELREGLPVPVVTIDSLGSSSSAGGRDTYIRLMRYNVDQLYEGWRKSLTN